jgi:PAS domain S-box-containing protein
MVDALENSELRYHKLFDNAGDAILIMQEDRLINCNKRTLELYLCSLDELFSLPPATFYPPTQPNGQISTEYFATKLEAVTRTGMPQFFEWTGRRLDGTYVDTEVTLTLFEMDNALYTQSIVRDITQRKKTEASLLNLNKTLETRVSQRTEELEEAYAELLQRNIHYRELVKRLAQAEEQERKRIAQLLHDNHQQLLVAAKFRIETLQNGAHSPDVQTTAGQILEILDEAVEMTRSLTLELAPPILHGPGLMTAIQWLARRMEEEHELKVGVYGALPSTRIPTEVSEILLRSTRELLFNVVKHADVKQARVSIAIVEQQLFLIVEDEGAGFDLAGVLEPTKAYGLFSIQEQLSSLDGRMDITSVVQQGTTCTLSIPVATAFIADSEVLPIIAYTTEPADTSTALRGPIRILIADDHTLVRKALVQTLSLANDFDVIGEAADGLDAIEKVRTLKPDIVLLDITMPQMNGIEATLSITSEWPEVGVIGLSMHPSDEMESRMLAAGAASYLQKLTPVDQLFATIRAVMNSQLAQ